MKYVKIFILIFFSMSFVNEAMATFICMKGKLFSGTTQKVALKFDTQVQCRDFVKTNVRGFFYCDGVRLKDSMELEHEAFRDEMGCVRWLARNVKGGLYCFREKLAHGRGGVIATFKTAERCGTYLQEFGGL